MTEPLEITQLQPGFLMEAHQDDMPGGLVLAIRGVVAHPDHRVRALQLNYHTEALCVAQVNAAAPRWAEMHGLAQDRHYHFRCHLLAGDLPERFTLTISAVFQRNGKDGIEQIARLSGKRAPLPVATHEPIEPLLVTSAGRSGSTLTMKILSMHPEVACPSFYPYETRFLTYLWRSCQNACRPADHRRSMGPDSFEAEYPYVGANPYFADLYLNRMPDTGLRDYFCDEHIRLQCENAKRCAQRYAMTLRASYGKPRARFLADKILPATVGNQIRACHAGAQEIFLVRDPRDSLISAMQFNEKRGSTSFGLTGAGIEQEMRAKAGSSRHLARVYRERKDSCLLVRYEDLMADPAVAVRRIYTHFSDASYDLDAVLKACFEEQDLTHATSGSGADSLERWRRELTEEEQAVAEEAFGEFLETFGYPAR
jgi:hypothetical protein